MQNIDIQQLGNTITYADYLQKVAELIAEGKISTSETKTTPALVDYTQQNMERMTRLNATAELSDDTLSVLSKIQEPTTWLNITEGWCGDASQVVPVIEKCALANPHITHRLVFRDDNLTLMDAFLTDGGRSIPKIIVLDASGRVLGSWGPRPQILQLIVNEQRVKMEAMDKEERKVYFEIVKNELHAWYDNNKTEAIQEEFSTFLTSAYGF
jgi:Thioredoxin